MSVNRRHMMSLVLKSKSLRVMTFLIFLIVSIFLGAVLTVGFYPVDSSMVFFYSFLVIMLNLVTLSCRDKCRAYSERCSGVWNDGSISISERRRALTQILFIGRVTAENIRKWEREFRERNLFIFEAGHSATNNESSSDNLPYLDNEGTRSCTICLEDYVRDEEFAITNECKHVFHSECILRWLEQHNECPICRKQVVNSTKIKEALQLHNITEALQLPSIPINRSESDTDESEIFAPPAPNNEVV